MKRRIGVVGYGHLGKYLSDAILERPDDLELAFVWNRTSAALRGQVEDKYILIDLSKFAERGADLIVEVAHPSISDQFGEHFLQEADYMVGSPTALADQEVETKLRKAAKHHGLYIPSGAFWGGEDILKMAHRGSLQALKVTMTKHPSSFKLHGALKDLNDKVSTERTVLYDGSVRGLCPLAPNNVNTMAAAAVAAHNLGFDKVQGCLVADPKLSDWHIVEVETWGPGDMASDQAFHVKTVRRNPAKPGAVTGSATYGSFLSSMMILTQLGEAISSMQPGPLDMSVDSIGCLQFACSADQVLFFCAPLGFERRISGTYFILEPVGKVLVFTCADHPNVFYNQQCHLVAVPRPALCQPQHYASTVQP